MIDDAINSLIDEALAKKTEVDARILEEHFTMSTRNHNAELAAHDWYNRAKMLEKTDRSALLSMLHDNYEHHKKLTEVHDSSHTSDRTFMLHNSYAWAVNRAAMDAFLKAYNDIKAMMSNLSARPKLSLNLLFSNTIDTDKTVYLNTTIGSEHFINDQLSANIVSSVNYEGSTGPLFDIIQERQLKKLAAYGLQRKFLWSSNYNFVYREKEVKIDLGYGHTNTYTWYIYQVVGEFTNSALENFTVRGELLSYIQPIEEVNGYCYECAVPGY